MSEQNPYDASSASAPAPAPAGDSENLSTVDWVIAILCSGIGCIIGIVRLIQGKKNGGKMLAVSLVMVVVWNIINFVLQSMVEQAP